MHDGLSENEIKLKIASLEDKNQKLKQKYSNFLENSAKALKALLPLDDEGIIGHLEAERDALKTYNATLIESLERFIDTEEIFQKEVHGNRWRAEKRFRANYKNAIAYAKVVLNKEQSCGAKP